MLEELIAIKSCLERENKRGAISDTLWISGYETLFDFIDTAIERAQDRQLTAVDKGVLSSVHRTLDANDWRALSQSLLEVLDPGMSPANPVASGPG